MGSNLIAGRTFHMKKLGRCTKELWIGQLSPTNKTKQNDFFYINWNSSVVYFEKTMFVINMAKQDGSEGCGLTFYMYTFL